jgi:hypothetical protein
MVIFLLRPQTIYLIEVLLLQLVPRYQRRRTTDVIGHSSQPVDQVDGRLRVEVNRR